MKQKQASAVQAVDRAMTILSALAQANGGQRLNQLAGQTNIHPSTTHRLLTTLERHEFVQYDSANKTWHIGKNAYAAARGFLGPMAFVAVAKPYIRKLRDTIQETCSLGVLEGQEVLVLAQFQGREIERILTRVGRSLPLRRPAMGRALLAAWWDHSDKPQAVADAITAITNAGPQEVEASIGIVRRLGYAVSEERVLEGVRSLAAAVCDATGRPICVVSISGTVDRLALERIDEVAAALTSTAAAISKAISVPQ